MQVGMRVSSLQDGKMRDDGIATQELGSRVLYWKVHGSIGSRDVVRSGERWWRGVLVMQQLEEDLVRRCRRHREDGQLVRGDNVAATGPRNLTALTCRDHGHWGRCGLREWRLDSGNDAMVCGPISHRPSLDPFLSAHVCPQFSVLPFARPEDRKQTRRGEATHSMGMRWGSAQARSMTR